MTKRYALLATIGGGLSVIGAAPDAYIGVAYSYSLSVYGGTAPYTFELLSTLPSGWSFDEGTGELTNADPDAAGSFDVTVLIRDAGWDYDLTYTYSVRTIALPLLITNNPPNYDAGVAQSFSYAASGGVAPYTWSVVGGALPPGITLDTDGTFHGTTVDPSGIGSWGFYSYTWQVRVTDSLGTTYTATNTVNVEAVLITITNAAPDGQVGTAYSHTYTTSGGTGTKTWDVASGTLPAGLSLSSAGVLSGTPTTAATSTFTVRVTDAGGTIATLAESVDVAIPTDPYWSNVIGLLHMEGSNGSTTFTDSKTGVNWTGGGGASPAFISTAQAKFGSSSLRNNGDSMIYKSSDSNYALGTGDFTFECWLYPVSGGGGAAFGRLFQIGANSTGGGLYIVRNNTPNPMRLLVQVHTGSAYANPFSSPANTIPNSQWTHIALTRASGVWRLFFDGAKVAESTYTSAGNNITQTSPRIAGNTPSGEWLNCYVDDVRITKGVARYTADFTPPTQTFPDA